MSPVDLRDLISDIRTALEPHPREALIEILTYVFKEYVVEGPAPLAATPPALAEDFSGMGFAQVIEALQLRLDLPELALFQVQGDRVFLQLGGRQVAIEAQVARSDPPPPPQPLVPAAPSPTSPPGSSGAAPPLGSAAAVPAEPAQAPGTSRSPTPAAAPRPVAAPMTPGGVTGARGNTTPGGVTPAAASPAPTTQPAPGGVATRPKTPPTEETSKSSGGFNLLEID